MKQCSKCKEFKDFSKFFNCKRTKDKFSFSCKDCDRLYFIKHAEEIKKYKQDYYNMHKEDILKKHKEYAIIHKQKISDQRKLARKKDPLKFKTQKDEYKKNNPEKVKENKRRDYLKHKEAYKARAKSYILNNLEKHRIAHKNYYEKNKDTLKQKDKIWRDNNRGVVNARARKRQLDKIQRTPKWLTTQDFEKIKQIYIQAAKLTKETGIVHHVDHIIPLKGKNVSGLHVPENLQILTREENMKKYNYF